MDKKNCFRLYVILIYFIDLWDIGRIDYKKKKTDLENLSFFLRVFWFLPCTVYETAR